MIERLPGQVRADHRDRNAARAPAVARSRLHRAACARGSISAASENAAANKETPNGRPVRPEAGGNGDGGQVHQVDEVRVVAEIRVQPDRIGPHRLFRVDRAGRRQQHHVHARPTAPSPRASAPRGDAPPGTRRRPCMSLPPRMISPTTGWTSAVCRARNSPTAASRSATHGPVEQRAGLAERREVDRRSRRRRALRAARPPARTAAPPPRRRRTRAPRLAARRNGTCRPATARRQRRCAASRVRDRLRRSPAPVATPRPASAALAAKIETQSSDRQAGTTPGRAEQAARRLQADEPVECGGHAARARRVGAERERAEPLRDRDGRAGARAAGDVRDRRTRSSRRRTATACPRVRWRTDRGWSCRSESRRRRAAARPRLRSASAR